MTVTLWFGPHYRQTPGRRATPVRPVFNDLRDALKLHAQWLVEAGGVRAGLAKTE
jgi:hypothetical protein